MDYWIAVLIIFITVLVLFGAAVPKFKIMQSLIAIKSYVHFKKRQSAIKSCVFFEKSKVMQYKQITPVCIQTVFFYFRE